MNCERDTKKLSLDNLWFNKKMASRQHTGQHAMFAMTKVFVEDNDTATNFSHRRHCDSYCAG